MVKFIMSQISLNTHVIVNSSFFNFDLCICGEFNDLVSLFKNIKKSFSILSTNAQSINAKLIN